MQPGSTEHCAFPFPHSSCVRLILVIIRLSAGSLVQINIFITRLIVFDHEINRPIVFDNETNSTRTELGTPPPTHTQRQFDRCRRRAEDMQALALPLSNKLSLTQTLSLSLSLSFSLSLFLSLSIYFLWVETVTC